MAQRLEKMERLISDFALEPKSITDSTSPRSVSEGSPSGGSPKDKLSKMSPTDILESIERPECGWKTTAGESESPEETTPREPYRGDRLMPHLLDAEDGGYNGIFISIRQMKSLNLIADRYRDVYILAFGRSTRESYNRR